MMSAFQQTVWDYYRQHGRHDLPWRQPEADGALDPYKVVVSELMLQQTQVGRVIPKYESFIRLFPSFEILATAPLTDVLKAWSGLGYNRRAKFLRQTAQIVAEDYSGLLPRVVSDLAALPGIGANTAGAIITYAFNEQVVFIETNIRTVFIHHFFPGQDKVADAELRPFIEKTLPDDSIREWYWALMDYGTHLKQTVGNMSRASAVYAKQSAFNGSRRQVRGRVLRALSEGPIPLDDLRSLVADERLESVLHDLTQEGFVEQRGSRYQLCA